MKSNSMTHEQFDEILSKVKPGDFIHYNVAARIAHFSVVEKVERDAIYVRHVDGYSFCINTRNYIECYHLDLMKFNLSNILKLLEIISNRKSKEYLEKLILEMDLDKSQKELVMDYIERSLVSE